MPMRALVLSKVTEAHGAGGMQRHLTWLLGWLAETGMNLTLLTTRGGALAAPAGLQCVVMAGTSPSRYNRAWWSETRRFVREQPRDAWDVIVSEDGGAWGVVEELRHRPDRPPIAMFRHGTTLLNLRQTLPPWRIRALGSALLSLRDYWRYPRRLGRSVDLMIAPTERIAASARVEGAGLMTEIRVIPLGVDLARFHPAGDPGPSRRLLGLDPTLPTLSWVGRDVPGKRIELTLSLFEHLISRGTPVQLLLAIASPRPSTLARIAAARALHGNRVRAVLDATADQMPAIHNASSCQLFPSTLAEGVPFAILEGLACGVPVLAGNTPSLRDLEVFRARPDWIVRPDSLEAWRERVVAVLAEPPADSRRGARALAEQHYDLRATALRSVQAIQELAARRRERASAPTPS